MDYLPTIGLEIHAELKTRTKMFCDSLNDPDEKQPNKNVCPVCLAHPGALPTINKKAVEAVVKVGIALGGRINPVSKFDRKNYFYPDLPKGYQISQYDQPLVSGGELLGVELTRIHLEEDTGTLVHVESSHQIGDIRNMHRGDFSFSEPEIYSLVDFNRAGIPLMELVTEPDIENAEQAVAFGKELQLILRYLGVSDADMEKGQMRLEANVSLSAKPQTDADGTQTDAEKIPGESALSRRKSALGTKVEVKNINSFRALGLAIKCEIERQKEILEKGERVVQETRGWDDAKQKTFSQRLKEEAHDYRYFPEPDLPPFEPTKIFDIEDMKRHLPELPAEKRKRFKKELGLSSEQAEFLVEDKKLADFFEAAASELLAMSLSNPSLDEDRETPDKRGKELLFNYLTSDLAGLMNESGTGFGEIKINPEQLAHLVNLIVDGKIMSRQAKDILKKMFESGTDPEDILESEGLHVISGEDELAAAVREIISENPVAVADFKKGKTASLEFLVGKAMAKLRGRGNPDSIRSILSKELTR